MIVVVVGPPAAGKSSLVQDRKNDGDVVVDFDLIAQALGADVAHYSSGGPREVAFAARSASIARVLEGIDSDAWIIKTWITPEQIASYADADARFVVLDPGKDEVLARAEADGRGDGTVELIEKWYADVPRIPAEFVLENVKGARMGRRIKASGLELATKSADGVELAEGEFIVYPSTFTREPDCYGDVVARGAFDETIAAWKASGNVLPGLYGHRMDDPDYFVAEAVDMGTDEHGWWVRGRFDLDNPKARQVHRLVKSRRLTQLSFAFDVLDEGRVTLDDGTVANELRRLKVYEFSFVPVGANQDTSVLDVKDAPPETDRESSPVVGDQPPVDGGFFNAKNSSHERGSAKDEEPEAVKSEESSGGEFEGFEARMIRFFELSERN